MSSSASAASIQGAVAKAVIRHWNYLRCHHQAVVAQLPRNHPFKRIDDDFRRKDIFNPDINEDTKAERMFPRDRPSHIGPIYDHFGTRWVHRDYSASDESLLPIIEDAVWSLLMEIVPSVEQVPQIIQPGAPYDHNADYILLYSQMVMEKFTQQFTTRRKADIFSKVDGHKPYHLEGTPFEVFPDVHITREIKRLLEDNIGPQLKGFMCPKCKRETVKEISTNNTRDEAIKTRKTCTNPACDYKETS